MKLLIILNVFLFSQLTFAKLIESAHWIPVDQEQMENQAIVFQFNETGEKCLFFLNEDNADNQKIFSGIPGCKQRNSGHD